MSLINERIGIELEIITASWKLGEAIKSKNPELRLSRLLQDPIHKDLSIPIPDRPVSGSDLTDTLLIIVAIQQKSLLSLVTLLAAGANPFGIGRNRRWAEWDIPKMREGEYKREVIRAMDCFDSLITGSFEDGSPPKSYEILPHHANMIYELKKKQLGEEQALMNTSTKRDTSFFTSSPAPRSKPPMKSCPINRSALPDPTALPDYDYEYVVGCASMSNAW